LRGPLAADRLRVVREAFTLELEPQSGAMRLRLAGGPALQLDPPRAGALGPSGPVLRARGRIKGACGPAERLELQWSPPGGPGLRRVVEVPEDGSGLAVELWEEPRGDAPGPGPRVPLGLTLPADAFALERLPLGGSDAGGEESGEEGGGEALLLAAPRAPAGPHLLLGWTGGPRRGALVGEKAEGALVGEKAEGALRLRAVDPGPAAPAPGPVATPRAWLGVSGSRAALLATWAERTGAELGARAPGRGGVTWPGARPSPRLDGLRPVRVRAAEPAAPDAAEEGPVPPAPDAWRVASHGSWRRLVGRADAVRVRDPLHHAFASRRLWLNASAPLDPGDPQTGHGATFETALVLAGLATGLVELARPPDDSAWTGARLALLRRVLPPLAREADRVEDGLCVRLLGARRAILCVNPGPEPRPLGLRLRGAEPGPGPWHVFDFAAGEDLGLRTGAVEPRTVPAGGYRLLGLTPPAGRPQVIGTTLHVGLGTLEVAALRPGARQDALELVLRHPGTHGGTVFVAMPGESHARRVEVDFRDEAIVPIPPRGG